VRKVERAIKDRKANLEQTVVRAHLDVVVHLASVEDLETMEMLDQRGHREMPDSLFKKTVHQVDQALRDLKEQPDHKVHLDRAARTAMMVLLVTRVIRAILELTESLARQVHKDRQEAVVHLATVHTVHLHERRQVMATNEIPRRKTVLTLLMNTIYVVCAFFITLS